MGRHRQDLPGDQARAPPNLAEGTTAWARTAPASSVGGLPVGRAQLGGRRRLRAALWTDPASLAILEAWRRLSPIFAGLITGQRKAFTAWSRAFQFAAAKPVKGGAALLGLAVTPDASPRLLEPKNESWSERLKAKLPLASPAEVDDEVARC
jgi:hypothetical protein